MLDTFKELIVSQFDAALCTHSACVDRCPPDMWTGPVANHTFSESAFHALFFADVYLGHDVESAKRQEFHRRNADAFADYEELEDRIPTRIYGKEFVGRYVQHCRTKLATAMAAETTESLAARPGFEWLKFSRAEVYVYNLRHIQHHAAQLILRLRQDAKLDVPWFGAGWRAT